MGVVRTFAFVDLCGFTQYTDTRGDDRAVEVLSRLRATLRGAAERHGIRVTRWLGDGAMTASVACEPLVAFVLEARDTLANESPLPLRAGIAEGNAIMFEGDDYVGAAVNIAARLCARAGDNQVLATAQVARQVGAMVTLRPVHTLRVPGVADPIEVRELLGPPPSHGREVVDDLVLPDPLRAGGARSAEVRAGSSRSRDLVAQSLLRLPDTFN